jgi:hypothetical protein
MVDPMPQREWIERRGLMVFIAETFTSLGSGLDPQNFQIVVTNNAVPITRFFSVQG